MALIYPFPKTRLCGSLAAFSGMSRPVSPLLSTLILSLLSLLSAFLLFQVQPVISKFILPWFGGSPGVWTTAMLFFQIVLFLGYTYAHALSRLPGRQQVIIHITLLALALVLLPITPTDAWKPAADGAEPSWRILGLLLASVGLPYFVLSSTSPLVQVWFTHGNPGSSPWRLYALSNIGSLGALVSFPFFFEPRWGVETLASGWSFAFWAYALLTLLVLWIDRQRAQAAEAETTAETPESPVEDTPPSIWRRIMWVLLPAIASAVLLAATSHVCHDVAVIPFMWVVPLSLYLLTFIICFEREAWYSRVTFLWALPALPLVLLTCIMENLQKSEHGWDKVQTWISEHGEWFQRFFPKDYDLSGFELDPNYLFELGWAFAAMFFACMVCHGELARLKPSPRRLTSFYLHMSAGGALGGLFVSLAAPKLFVSYAEWPLALIASFIVACIAFVLWIWRVFSGKAIRNTAFIIVGIAGCLGVIAMSELGFKDTKDRLELVRNFYGTLSVTEWDPGQDTHWRELSNGGIVHGKQNLAPEYRRDPTSYYGHSTGIGKALDSLRLSKDARVGVVGMGAGTVATYAESGHSYRFYDINPEVPRLAQKYFTYLPDLQARGAKLEIVVSDARLALEQEKSQQFDALLLDAFTGDSVPAHLLTREAFEIYKRHMKPDGIIAVHITNSYLRLAPLMLKTAAEVGYQTRRITTYTDHGDHDSTDYVLFTNNASFLAAVTDVPPDDEELDKETKIQPRVWTDKHHDLFQVLMFEVD